MARVITTEEYNLIIDTIRNGFSFENVGYRPNNRIATALSLQANLGLRVGDLLNLRLSDIVKQGDIYKLDIVEDKTNKKRIFIVPMPIYSYILEYCVENNISCKAKIFDISVRGVQKHLKSVCSYLGFEDVGTHSFRKYFATNIYINNNYNIVLVKQLLQHSDIKTTQRYINMSSAEIEIVLNNHLCLR